MGRLGLVPSVRQARHDDDGGDGGAGGSEGEEDKLRAVLVLGVVIAEETDATLTLPSAASASLDKHSCRLVLSPAVHVDVPSSSGFIRLLLVDGDGDGDSPCRKGEDTGLLLLPVALVAEVRAVAPPVFVGDDDDLLHAMDFWG